MILGPIFVGLLLLLAAQVFKNKTIEVGTIEFPRQPWRYDVAPGWYADPWDRRHWRYWDGLHWTHHTDVSYYEASA